MNREQQAISANFELLLTSIRKSSVHTEGAADVVVVGQEARSNLGSEFKPAAALHLEAHDDFLMNSFGRCNE